MNRALWRKAVSDSWRTLCVSGLLLVLYGWVFVWLTSLLKFGVWLTFLDMLPGFVEKMVGMPLANLASPTGRLSVVFVHIVTLLICIGWAIGRGSDTVSGEIVRGTMELIATLPVRRASVLVPPAVVATVGAAVLPASLWAGATLGLMTFQMEAAVHPGQFLPGVLNLFAMTFCFAGITTFLSSWNRNRWRTIWMAVGLFVICSIIEMISRLWPAGWWLKYFTLLTAFEPQRMIVMPDEAWSLSLRYDGTLLAIGLAGYAAAAIVFSYRDIPVSR